MVNLLVYFLQIVQLFAWFLDQYIGTECPIQMMLWRLDVTLAEEDAHSNFAGVENEVEESVGKMR